MSAAVVSTSVIGSAAIMIQLRPRLPGGEASGSAPGTSGRWRRTAARRTGRSRRPGAPPLRVAGDRGSRACPGPARAWSGTATTTRRNTLKIESATATAMPWSTPRSATPRNAVIDRANSARRCRHSRTVPGMSASDSDCGDHDRGERRVGEVLQQSRHEHQHQHDQRRSDHPVSCVFAPACSATAVREPLVLTGKALEEPRRDVRRADPDHLPVAVDLLPVRAANADAVEIVSVRATSAIPRAPATNSGRSETGLGTVKRREPLRQGSDQRDAVVRRGRTPGGRDRQDHGDEHAGHPRQPTPERHDQPRLNSPTSDRGTDRLARKTAR